MLKLCSSQMAHSTIQKYTETVSQNPTIYVRHRRIQLYISCEQFLENILTNDRFQHYFQSILPIQSTRTFE